MSSSIFEDANSQMLHEVATASETPLETLCVIARHKNASADTLELLSRHSKSIVRCAVARRYTLKLTLAERLAKDSNEDVSSYARARLNRHTARLPETHEKVRKGDVSLSEHLLLCVAYGHTVDEPDWILSAVLKHPNTPSNVLETYRYRKGLQIDIAQSENTSPEVLEWLAKRFFGSAEVKHAAAANLRSRKQAA